MGVVYGFWNQTDTVGGVFDFSGASTVSFNQPSYDGVVLGAFTGTNGLSLNINSEAELDTFWDQVRAKVDQIDTAGLDFAGDLGGSLRAVGGWGGDDFIFTAPGGAFIAARQGNDIVTMQASAADTLNGGRGDDTLNAGGGADSVDGGRGDDILYASAGDGIHGGAGFDRMLIDGGDYVVVDGGAGAWSLFQDPGGLVGGALTGVEWIAGTAGDDQITAGGDLWVIDGGAGADTVTGGVGDDFLKGGGGDDVIDGGAGSDQLRGGAGRDTLSFTLAATGVDVQMFFKRAQDTNAGIKTIGRGFENFQGSNHDDRVIGERGANRLEGLAGDDTLRGRQGSDSIVGGDGADYLRGGDWSDSDTYIYLSESDSLPGFSDIVDFAVDDIFDVSAVDADLAADGDQAFTIGGAQLTGVVGELAIRYNAANDVTVLSFDTDGDAQADMIIRCNGDVTGILGFAL